MGIDLGDVVVRRPTTMAQYAGKRLAIDGWNILYQFLSSIRQSDGTPLMDRDGRVTSHLLGILTRTGAMVEAGIRPVFVFDGPPHALKARTLAERQARKLGAAEEERKEKVMLEGAREALAQAVSEDEREAAKVTVREREASTKTKAQQTSRLTPPMVDEARTLLHALGIPTVQAPGEGEAQAAWMAATGACDACVSQDFDAILFGAPVLVRNLSVGGRRKLPGKQAWVEVGPEEIPLAETLAALGLAREQLVDAAILVGTDFHQGVKGVGARKAVAMIARDGSLEGLLDRLADTPSSATSAAERMVAQQAASLADRAEVRRIFLEPAHTPADDLALRAPDVEAVRSFLAGYGFAPERIASGLARFTAARGRQGQKTLF